MSNPLLKPLRTRPQLLLAIMMLFVVVGVVVVSISHAANDALTLSPATSTVSLGSSFSVTITENSGTDPVNAVEADLTYDQSKVQFASVDATTSAFSVQAANSGGGGIVTIARGVTGGAAPLTGSQTVAIVNFTTVAPGSAAINFAGSSAIVRSTDSTNVLVTKTGGTYTIADTTAPTVPTGLTSPTQTVSSNTLNWTASTDNVGVTGYKVYRNGTQVGTSASTSFTDTGLTPKTAYSYTVAAFDAAGNTSAQSTTQSFTTLADTTAPSVPTGLVKTANTLTSINFSWTASTDNVGVTGYKVYRGGVQIATGASTSFSDTGLTPGTSFPYTVAAFDAAGNTSNQSTAGTFSTLADTTPPSVPTGLSASGQTATTIPLSWIASTDNVGVTGYKIYRNAAQVGTSSTSSYTDTGLTGGVSYSYTVAAFDAAGNTSSQSTAGAFSTVIKVGDLNGDGVIDILDLSIFCSNYGKTGATRAMGDLNGDGTINIIDLSILLSHYGT